MTFFIFPALQRNKKNSIMQISQHNAKDFIRGQNAIGYIEHPQLLQPTCHGQKPGTLFHCTRIAQHHCKRTRSGYFYTGRPQGP
jgi:hypothetical protein